MSGSGIPYHLRPHKAVDRRLFIDLLTRLERWRPLHNYAYISMGAYPLEDHKLVHRVIGIKRLLAFDFDQDIVNRQLFNRPISACKCIKAKSGDVIDDFDKVLRDNKVDDNDGVIVWLDYTNPKDINHQIREFQALIDKLRSGDIVRVTVNAHVNEYSGKVDSAGKALTAPQKRELAFDTLKSKIGEYLPSGAKPDDITAAGFPLLLAHAFGKAVHEAYPATSKNTFQPLSIIRYADGLQMLTITGIVIARTEVKALKDKLDLKNWPFTSAQWSAVHHLVVPSLTLRERLFFEREIGNRADRILRKLKFTSTDDLSVREFLKSYKHYYRFYPTLLSADV